MDDRQRFTTGNPWEKSVGFSRAVKVGNTVYTAGTIASDENGKVQGTDSYEQCSYIFKKLDGVLKEAGSGLGDVVKVVCYLTDITHSEGFTRAHSEHLGETRPATTCVVINALFGEGFVAEIELTAVIPG